MATNDIPLKVSDNTERVSLRVSDGRSVRSITPDSGSPYYVGARAYVTQTENGAVVTVIDKDGTTTATILNGADGEDGYTPIKGVDYFDGEDGQDGQDGQDGADGADGFSPIATVAKSGDTATISITDANGTTTATVSDGQDGADGQDGYTPIKGVDYFDGRDGTDGQDGQDGADGVGIANITKTATVGLVDTYTITYTDGSTSTYQVTNGANGSGSVADVWVDGDSVLDGDTAKIDLTGKSDIGHTHTRSDITDFPTIPSKTSDLTNDSGFITGYTETDPIFVASAAHGISSSDISNWNGKSDFSGDYNDLTNKPTIPTVPTNVSSFTNDAGYLTSYTETDPTVPAWAKAASKPSYTASEVGALPSSTAIPSATSDLTNDSGFLNASGILNLFYPIGSYYETSDTAFNPNTTWGGTWILETEGQVHISAGSNYSVAGALTNATDGGEVTHILTTAEMPTHSHHLRADVVRYINKTANVGSGSKYKFFSEDNSLYTDNAGGDGAHNNMQPYIVVNRWHRTA